jgi:peptidoglycan/xylan/chitin deacetylase (PgdA/CDA1 family)
MNVLPGPQISLMYHDVAPHTIHKSSGFPDAGAAIYKLEPDRFARHLRAIKQVVTESPILVTDLLAENFSSAALPWMLTFDDGGASSYTPIADMLESSGWRAHFFITTDYIDKSAFMTHGQIRELHKRGHIIGSHSCSHPLRFALRSADEMKREWRLSLRVLSDLLGEDVRIASVPGGQYSRKVAESAAAEGIRALFTSEPTSECAEVDGCLLLGRYAIRQGTSAEEAAGMVEGKFMPRLKQRIWWDTKKIIKSMGGEYYLKVREAAAKRLTNQ